MLERAILDAALAQLSGVGWNGPTVEGVGHGVRDVRNSRPGLALRGPSRVRRGSRRVPPHADRGGRLRPLERAPKQLLGRLLERGIARGEVCPEALDGLVLDVIPAMMMRRSKMCGSEWINDEVAEVIDRNMVPLVRSSPS